MRLQPSEREVQNSILELLRLSGVFALRLQTGAAKIGTQLVRFHSGGAGVADIVAFVPWTRAHEPCCPRVLWIEVKSGKGYQTPEQKSFENHVTNLGMDYLLARNLDTVTAWLREHR